MVQAAFDCAGACSACASRAREDLPVYHPDVKAYEVRDAAGEVVAIFLQDNFARAAKRSGAWMSTLRVQSRNEPGGGTALPVVLNNNNFAKGAPGAPTLLSLDDVRTLFHEFGHGLHGMLSDVTYERLSGTAGAARLCRAAVAAVRALDVRAGGAEAARAPLADRRADPRRADRAHARRAALQPGLRDGALLRQRLRRHGRARACRAREMPADLSAWEAAELQRLGLPDGVGMNHRLVHFQHLFSGSGYAAGYYVYLWAEVLDADGYEAFKEAGDPFDADVSPQRCAATSMPAATASSRVRPMRPSAAARRRWSRCCASAACWRRSNEAQRGASCAPKIVSSLRMKACRSSGLVQ